MLRWSYVSVMVVIRDTRLSRHPPQGFYQHQKRQCDIKKSLHIVEKILNILDSYTAAEPKSHSAVALSNIVRQLFNRSKEFRIVLNFAW
jgi:hypothetical protein